MKTQTFNALGKTILFSLITTMMTNANTQDNKNEVNTLPYDHTATYTIYRSMSTEQLQKEVEKHSQNGNLSFAMGQELIKRWTKI